MLNSNILKAYQAINLNKYDMKSFSDNAFAAFTLIEKDHITSTAPNNLTFNHSGIKGGDLMTLARMLCCTYPPEITGSLIKIIGKKEEENVNFEEFLNAIKTIMLYDGYFEEMQPLFKYLDYKS